MINSECVFLFHSLRLRSISLTLFFPLPRYCPSLFCLSISVINSFCLRYSLLSTSFLLRVVFSDSFYLYFAPPPSLHFEFPFRRFPFSFSLLLSLLSVLPLSYRLHSFSIFTLSPSFAFRVKTALFFSRFCYTSATLLLAPCRLLSRALLLFRSLLNTLFPLCSFSASVDILFYLIWCLVRT